MRFLDNIPELDLLARALSVNAPGVKVSSRVEAYTIKPLARDRALLKRLDASGLDAGILDRPPLQMVPPSAASHGIYGSAEHRDERKTLWLLIGTLNLAHPDHDFANLTFDDFVREASATTVLAEVSAALGHLRQPSGYSSSAPAGSSPPKYSTSWSSLSSSAGSNTVEPSRLSTSPHPVLRQVLDPVIELDECEVYSYSPDFDSDPHNGVSDSEDDGGTSDGDADDGLPWPMDGLSRALPRRPHSRPLSIRTPRRQRAIPAKHPRSYSDSTGGLLWSVHYFFINRKRKRLLFVSLWARATENQSLTPLTPSTPSLIKRSRQRT